MSEDFRNATPVKKEGWGLPPPYFGYDLGSDTCQKPFGSSTDAKAVAEREQHVVELPYLVAT